MLINLKKITHKLNERVIFYMKKTIIIVLSIFIIYQITNNKENIIIPKSAIRLRIIADSNSVYDQYIKNEVKKIMEAEIKDNLNDITEIETSRNIIKSNINKYREKIEKLFIKKNYNKEININFGLNYFPKKVYKGVTYEQGDYEYLVITIGSGQGDNWWCVLFPPLCFLDFGDGDHVHEHNEEHEEEIEVSFFIVEVVMNLWHRITA